MWEAIKKAIETEDCFLLCTHRDPDADGVGSQLALHHALRRMGKSATVLNPDTLPHALRFLDPEGVVVGFDSLSPEESARRLDQAERIFFIDAGIWRRLGPLMGPAVQARADKVLIIDHHPSEGGAPAGSVQRESASSSGEMVYDLFESMGLPLDERTAFCLYSAIAKDTGCFRFENTTHRVFEIASRLTRFDIGPHHIYDYLFERWSKNSVVLLGQVLGTLAFAYDNRLAWISMTRRMREETGVPVEDTENFINIIRSIDPVQACMFFRETDDGKVRISLRSKTPQVDVNLLAGKFGGGGHKRASGVQIKGELDEVIRRVVEAAAEYF
ncbi:bifunctional oligoribonuclease/PAP phosphatase NrnA [bacterium]|nr:bifunctional oligoribonuclease/PAP phosphatase NrnA [bacterium]